MTFYRLYLSKFWRKFLYDLGRVDTRPYWRSNVDGHR